MRKLCMIFMSLLLLTGCSGPSLQRQTFTVELGQDIYANAALYIKDAQNYPTDDWEVEAEEFRHRKDTKSVYFGKYGLFGCRAV